LRGAGTDLDATDHIDDAPEKVAHFGENTPLKRPGQPAELAPAYVLLASDEGSYMSGALIPVTGGRPML
jgi:NAD(P)-dependent dehydrogenase (short-subunit alcohol dehydrogenase family)